MSLLVILGIAIGLAMDAFAVSIATSISLGRVTGRQLFRFSWHFGLFQAVMPFLGWLAGQSFAVYIMAWDHWVAFALLMCVGGKAIYAALRMEDPENPIKRGDPTRGMSLVIFSVATSIDALAVGLSFAMLEVTIWYPCIVIGIVAAAFTLVGMLLGGKLGIRFGKRIEVLGGLILVGIGLKILIQHLTA